MCASRLHFFRYRLRRTLEVALSLHSLQDKEEMAKKLYTGERSGGLDSLGYDVRCFFLCPDDRMGHTRVIDRRCEQMLLRGLLKETAGTSTLIYIILHIWYRLLSKIFHFSILLRLELVWTDARHGCTCHRISAIPGIPL